MPFTDTDINGIELYYEIQGIGDPIVLLHHGFGCTKMWDKIAPKMIDTGFKTICYDRRGFGQSGLGESFEEFYVSDRYRCESVAELEAFRDWLGVPTFHLVGQCEGGVIALDYAAKYPERVKDVVISSTLCAGAAPMDEFNASKFAKSFQELDPDLKSKLETWHGPRTESFFEQFRRFGGAYGKDYFDIRPVLPQVTCPALVLYPDRSFLFEVEQGLAFYRNLPNAELAVLPNCGHNTYDEQPEEYASHILSFIARRQFGEYNRRGDKPVKAVTCAG
jgi:pimeloyl-ACP methyl ester carboxylesterase